MRKYPSKLPSSHPSKSTDKEPQRSLRSLNVVLHKKQSRSLSQQNWLRRQLNDPYVQAAHLEGWRSRAAYKLIELNERFHLIKPGMNVVDLGTAPGGWAQVALHLKARCVVAVDLLPIDPIPGCYTIQGDLHDPILPACIKRHLDGPLHLVMSDMAPNTTGHAATDHMKIVGLAELALDFAIKNLSPGGNFIVKVFQGGAERDMLTQIKKAFTTVRHAKPPASRKESSELYVVATNFRQVSHVSYMK